MAISASSPTWTVMSAVVVIVICVKALLLPSLAALRSRRVSSVLALATPLASGQAQG